MGFGGGGGAQLTNHVHDNTPLQGGPLNFNGTTIGGMNSGDLTYSDGAALQQLAISAPNDQLRVSAGNIPEWFTPAAGSSVWTELVNQKNVGTANIDVSWLGTYNILKIFFYGAPSASAKTGITFNSDNAGNYSSGGDAVYTTELSNYLQDLTTGEWQYSVVDFYNIADKAKQGHTNTTILNADNSIYKFEAWQAWRNTADLINSVQVVEKNAGTLQTYLADSHIVILGAN